MDFLRGILLVLVSIAFTAYSEAQSIVQLQRANNEWQLLRNGAVYFIRGVGGHTSLKMLAANGGNSIRTWSDDNLQAILDEAHTHGLSVCVGIWLGHERHGFNYQDEASVLRQLENSLSTVQRFRSHPAVLLWGIGNEMEGDGQNPAVWYAVDHIAREVKRLDPDHPTMTVIAELGEDASKARSLERYCPHIDIIGVNSYAGISTLPDRYRAAGIQRPYIVTEHGPAGPWESGKTSWGASLELSSSGKAISYAEGYETTALRNRDQCLGTYAFLWGHKQETTATWFGMLLPDGSRLAAVDSMQKVWTGAMPSNQCPGILSLTLDRVDGLKAGETVRAALGVADPDGDPLNISWVLSADSGIVGTGGDAEAAEEIFPDAVKSAGDTATIVIPESGGHYRLFAYVRDGHGGAAVANVPLRVDAPIRPRSAPQATLPFVVYGDSASGAPFVPSGYMGNTKAIRMKPDCTETPFEGETCLKIEYTADSEWGGVLWQSPAGDWAGTKPGGLNLTGASALEFRARGQTGAETVSFTFGGKRNDALYHDTAHQELLQVRLSTSWTKYRIPLDGKNLTRIKTAFGWSLAADGQPVTFYLDDIRIISE